tara:strand:+ start:216 stop:434 length:219 start_codon:yes stop_codon:yes gene_type:complete
LVLTLDKQAQPVILIYMKELMEEIKALQSRLQNCGGGKITITSEKFDIALGKEHEQDAEKVDVEMIKTMYNA